MSGRYVTTQTCFYTDPDLDGWGPLTKFFYEYLYRNDHAHGVTGVGRIRDDIMIVETGMTQDEINTAIEQIQDRVRWFMDGTYWVIARAKHTCITNKGNVHSKYVASAVLNIWQQQDQLRREFYDRFNKVFDGLLPTEWQSVGDLNGAILPTKA